jgi:hypothetical protein
VAIVVVAVIVVSVVDVIVVGNAGIFFVALNARSLAAPSPEIFFAQKVADRSKKNLSKH